MKVPLWSLIERKLIDPWVPLDQLEARQNARAVALTTLLMIPLSGIRLLAGLVQMGTTQLLIYTLIAFTFFQITSLASYVLARRGRVMTATLLLLSGMMTALFATSLFIEADLLPQVNFLYLVPVMMATVLLSARLGLMTLLGALLLCTLSIIANRGPGIHPQMLGGMVVLLSCGVFSVVTIMHVRRIMAIRAQELEASEARLRLLTDNMSDAITMTVDGTTMAYYSRSMPRIFGYTEAELSRELSELMLRVHPDDIQRISETMSATRRYGLEILEEYRWRMPDGTYHWFETLFTTARSEKTGTLTTIFSSRDITARKEAELAVARERELLRTVIDALPDTIFIKDREGRYMIGNKAHRQFMRAAEDLRVEHKTSEELFAADEAAFYMAQDKQVFETGQPIIDQEFTVKRPEGMHYFMNSKFPILNEGGEVIGLVGIARDISERRRFEGEKQKRHLLEVALRKEREINELKNLFMVTVSHEFRTPLATILSSSELLETYGDRMSPERRMEALATVRGQVVRLSRMLDDIRTLLHLQSGTMALNLEKLDLAHEVQTLVNACVPERSARSTLVTSTLEPSIVLADRLMLRQIITHVVNNALAYSPENTPIEVTLSPCDTEAGDPSPSMICLRVRDYGKGIPPEELERVFAPFFRGTESLAVGGSGLGLTIVRYCVDMYGGSVTLSSQGPDTGTEVTIRLPIYTDAENEARRVLAAQRESGEATVDAVLQSGAE
ncbi:MAG: PAS domain-containing sensor histidine kinase [Pleurocapsa minor GSE-CHR-MK-17-07R]|jgi:PAS domain S-box-containing protein|nr:PAS domain-containing sensor histidine kinase [Pleurocapsa minor GSE-CHR-MK 17-07R]